EGLQPCPGVSRRLRSIGVALVAKEAVGRLRVDDGLERLAVALGILLERVHLGERDEGIVLAEERQDGRLQRRGAVDRESASVERDGRTALVGQSAGGEKAD